MFNKQFYKVFTFGNPARVTLENSPLKQKSKVVVVVVVVV